MTTKDRRARTIFYPILRLDHRVGQLLDKSLGPVGITAAQFVVLDLLSEVEPASSAELARLIEITPQSVGTFVRALEYKGLIEGSVSAENRNVSLRSRTQKGIQTHKLCLKLIAESEAKFVGSADPAEIESIKNALNRLLELSANASS